MCVVQYTVNATHQNDFFGLPGTNPAHRVPHVAYDELNDDGLIEHDRRIYDFNGLLVQLGVLPRQARKPHGDQGVRTKRKKGSSAARH